MKIPLPIEQIKALGFDVYARKIDHQSGVITHGYYTDGINIGYIQSARDHGIHSISTVHIPNRESGTGFGLGDIDEITKEVLESAFKPYPKWANGKQKKSVVKYANWEAFQNANKFNKEYIKLCK